MDLLTQTETTRQVLSVSELNSSAKRLLECTFPLLWVSGEISNIKCYGSGHWYFSLKDLGAQVRCVMFRDRNRYLDWHPGDGMRVEVRALVTLYQTRGEFQLSVETMRRAGRGILFEGFEQLREKLGKEGLFDPGRKTPLPAFPTRLGIITSPNSAALHDVLTTLRRRMPSLPVIVYPAPAQGDGAGRKIAAAVQNAARRAECDVLILCRGGGSVEDLWAFNEEAVARAIAACPIPLVTGIGHETDFTIADFVADTRAPTPTGASHVACPDCQDLLQGLKNLHYRVSRGIRQYLEYRMQHADTLASRLIHPRHRIENQRSHLGSLRTRLAGAWRRSSENKFWYLRDLSRRSAATSPDLERLIERQGALALRLQKATSGRVRALSSCLERQHAHLAHLNPESIMERGYSVTYTQDGRVVKASDQLTVGDVIEVIFAKGRSKASVLENSNQD